MGTAPRTWGPRPVGCLREAERGHVHLEKSRLRAVSGMWVSLRSCGLVELGRGELPTQGPTRERPGPSLSPAWSQPPSSVHRH